MGKINSEFVDGIGTITLNNDEKRNRLSPEILKILIFELDKMKENKARVVILRANKGAKIWSAGFDITSLPDPGTAPLSYFDPLQPLLGKIQKLPCPVIAMIDGSVWGGACDMSFVCDLIVATGKATFAITPAKIGVPYNSSGIIHFINTVGMQLAKQMFYTAKPVSAERLYSLGVINYLTNSEEIEHFTYELANTIKENSPLAMSVIKEQIRIFGNSYSISPESYEAIENLRTNAYNSKDYIEGKQSFIEKRKPNFIGE